MENNIRILCTRPVDAALVQQAVSKGICVDTVSFIETVAIHDDELDQKISLLLQQTCTVIFTSMNAVEAVAKHIKNEQPGWSIFCLANTTKALVAGYFGEDRIVATAESATALAGEILTHKERISEPVIFFCGDQRRDELPFTLKQNSIKTTEIVTYRTIETTQKVEARYDGFLFFSSSAVHSFFRLNRPPENAILFALGTTTANTISGYCDNRIVKSERPLKEELLKQALEVFAIEPST